MSTGSAVARAVDGVAVVVIGHLPVLPMPEGLGQQRPQRRLHRHAKTATTVAPGHRKVTFASGRIVSRSAPERRLCTTWWRDLRPIVFRPTSQFRAFSDRLAPPINAHKPSPRARTETAGQQSPDEAQRRGLAFGAGPPKADAIYISGRRGEPASVLAFAKGPS